MKSAVILTVFLLVSSHSRAQSIRLERGFVLTRKEIRQSGPRQSKGKPRPLTGLIATSPSQFDPYIRRKIDGIEYLIAYDSKTRKITFIHTIDKNFRTKDGLKLGDCVQYKEDQVHKIRGWYVYGPESDDGWRPVLGVDFLETERANGKPSCWTISGFSKR
jgi:hypothetical protein